MKDKILTVTRAARYFARYVNQVHYQHTSFVLVKNGKPFARLVPDREKVCTGRNLAEALDRALRPAKKGT